MARWIFGWPIWLDRCLDSYSTQSSFNYVAPKRVSMSMVETDGSLSSSEAGLLVVLWHLSPFSVSFLWPFYGALAPFPSLFSPSLGPVMWVRMLLSLWLSSPETGLMAPERFIERWRTGVPAWEDSGTSLFKNGHSEGMQFQPTQSEGLRIANIWFITSQHQEHPLMCKEYI